MFRKLVSNLSYSPALVGQLGFYAKRLKGEEATRRIGLIFIALSLVVQSLVVFQPSESANAASGNDFVNGGLGVGSAKSLDNFIKPYDANSSNLKDTLNYFGITRQELTSTKFGSWKAGEKLSWGFQSKFSYAQGERAVKITDPEGNYKTTIYGRPNKLFNGANTSIYGWYGHSTKIGWFAIMQVCGNLVTDIVPPVPVPPTPPTPVSTPVPTPPTPVPVPTPPVLSKSAINTSQSSIDATKSIAQANNQIRYTINVENTGLALQKVDLKENLRDTLEYSSLIDNGGGTFNNEDKTLSWPSITLEKGEKQSRVFAVRLLESIPATAQGQSEPTSYDCIMTNTFGNQIDIPVNCTTPKVVEQVVNQLPKTGPTENILFGGILLSIATFFYARTRQIKSEVRLLRRNINTGNI